MTELKTELKVAYKIEEDGKRVDFYPLSENGSYWSCWPRVPLATFFAELTKLADINGYHTPWDYQEIACNAGLACWSAFRVSQ